MSLGRDQVIGVVMRTQPGKTQIESLSMYVLNSNLPTIRHARSEGNIAGSRNHRSNSSGNTRTDRVRLSVSRFLAWTVTDGLL